MEPTESFTDEALYEFVKGPLAGLKPRPSPGWMSVELLPGMEIDAYEDLVLPSAIEEKMGDDGNLVVEQINKQKPKIVGCRVVEIAQVPTQDGLQTLPLPYGKGDTVFVPSNFGTNIGDFRFFYPDKVICWLPAEGSEGN